LAACFDEIAADTMLVPLDEIARLQIAADETRLRDEIATTCSDEIAGSRHRHRQRHHGNTI
jgi:hypothetical protein